MSQKVAIYSGEIPSTTFIERLIQGLSAKGHSIYLFGHISKKVVYPPNVKVSAYQGKFSKLLQWIKWSVLLGLFRSKEKQKLDAILHQQYERSIRYAQLKAYPFLWYRPDIVHIQWAKNIREWMWLQDFGMKIVLSLRGAHINYSPLADATLAASYRACFPKIETFHAVSEAIANEAETYGAAPEKIKVIYSGLDLQIFQAVQKTDYAFKKGINILSVGRYHWIKGYQLALDALAELNENYQYTLSYHLIAGKANEEIRYQLDDLKISDKVVIYDQMPSEQVFLKMKTSDLLLIPSMKEGLANVALEAMAIGLPVLSSDGGGMQEVIHQGENGFLFKSMDVKDLTEKLNAFLSTTEEQRSAMANKARQKIAQEHTEVQMIRQMKSLYQTCA